MRKVDVGFGYFELAYFFRTTIEVAKYYSGNYYEIEISVIFGQNSANLFLAATMPQRVQLSSISANSTFIFMKL